MAVDSLYANIPAGVGTTVVSAKAGVRIGKAIVIGPVGAGVVTIFDSNAAASGPILCVIPASAPIGQYFLIEIECINGIVVLGATSSPAINVSYST